MTERDDAKLDAFICFLAGVATICIVLWAFWWAGQPSVMH